MVFYGNQRKWSDEIIKEIRHMSCTGISTYRIAKDLKTSPSVITKIINRLTYKDVK